MTDEQEQACIDVHAAALAVARRQSAPVARHADDIAMSVVAKFLERSTVEVIENPVAWARSRARFDCTTLASDEARVGRRQQPLPGDDDEGSDWQAWLTDLGPSGYPYRTAANADAFERMLGCLSNRERLVLALSAAGCSHEEIAADLGYASPRVVTTTLSRIRRKVIEGSGSLSEVLDRSIDLLVCECRSPSA